MLNLTTVSIVTSLFLCVKSVIYVTQSILVTCYNCTSAINITETKFSLRVTTTHLQSKWPIRKACYVLQLNIGNQWRYSVFRLGTCYNNETVIYVIQSKCLLHVSAKNRLHTIPSRISRYVLQLQTGILRVPVGILDACYNSSRVLCCLIPRCNSLLNSVDNFTIQCQTIQYHTTQSDIVRTI